MATRLTSTTQVGSQVAGIRPLLTVADTSEESKQHSKEVLDQEFNGGNVDTSGDKNPNNVAGGLKAYVCPSCHHHP